MWRLAFFEVISHLVKDRMDITGARWDCPAPKRSSNYEPSTATATSPNTGTTTSTKNNNESTGRATPIPSSRTQHDTPSTEPYPFQFRQSGIPIRRCVFLALFTGS